MRLWRDYILLSLSGLGLKCFFFKEITVFSMGNSTQKVNNYCK